jgi:hypothetical protein
MNGNFINSFFFQTSEQTEIVEILKSLRSETAAGHNKIHMWSIKESIEFIAKPLTHLINLSIESGVALDQMKIARIIPIFKSGTDSLFQNYRPVSFLPIFSKLLERVVYNRLIKYIDKHGILFDNQYGFRDRSLFMAGGGTEEKRVG